MTFKKYFIAIVIPEPFLGEIEGMKTALFKSHGLKGALRCPAHITFHRPFEWKEEKENILIEKLAQFQLKNPFDIFLKDFAFFEPRVIYIDVLPNAHLNEMHIALTQYAKRELKLFNESEDMRGFHPHVTIAFRDLKKSIFYALKSDFSQKQFDCQFNFTRIALLKLDKNWQVLQEF